MFGQLAGRGEYAQMVAAGATGMEVVGFEHGADESSRIVEVPVAVAVHERLPAGRLGQTEQEPKGCRLPGAVRTQEACDAARPQPKRQVVNRKNVAAPP